MRVALVIVVVMLILLVFFARLASETLPEKTMLSDPFLQLPTENSVYVVWFTEFAGTENYVIYGEELNKRVEAKTTQLTKVREDQKSRLSTPPQNVVNRKIWRHEALVEGLNQGKTIPYQVISQDFTQKLSSRVFTLTAKPQPETPLKILLTSDHQLMPMTSANLQKVVEVIGKVDGVFLAGDLTNIPDRASEWFDDQRGGAFFPCLQGKANYQLTKNGVTTVYQGGELIQYAPLFPAIGNHEVMGKYSPTKPLNEQFDDSIPRQVVASDDQALDKQKIKDLSFNTDTYEEIFTLPENSPGGKKYYSITFGDIWLGVLYVTNMWRSPSLSPEVKGRYQERTADLNHPERWGYGQHIFEPIEQGSLQYLWLEQELNSEAFQKAKYKIVMFHHPPHTLGSNIVPPYTNPIQQREYTKEGELAAVRYNYPKTDDYIIRDLIPLLESAGVQLVFYGHSHLWNRFYNPASGTHFLESSNVGNSYGAHWGENKRMVPPANVLNEAIIGNPNGLEPVVPNLAPLTDNMGVALPYIASNDITVFSILDTSKGTVSSYRFDTREPHSSVIKFDEFVIGPNRGN